MERHGRACRVVNKQLNNTYKTFYVRKQYVKYIHLKNILCRKTKYKVNIKHVKQITNEYYCCLCIFFNLTSYNFCVYCSIKNKVTILVALKNILCNADYYLRIFYSTPISNFLLKPIAKFFYVAQRCLYQVK